MADEVECPLCGGTHDVRVSEGKNSTPYIRCPKWKLTLFFNQGAGLEYFNKKAGATAPQKKARGDDYFP